MKVGLLIVPLLFLLLFSQSVYGQDEYTTDSIPSLYIADLDLDGIQDSIIYDKENYELVFRLSSKGYSPERYGYELEDNLPFWTRKLYVNDGGFSIAFLHMRAESLEEYVYKKEAARFELETLFFSHNQFGSMVYSNKNHTFTGDWWYYDSEGIFIDLPQVKLILEMPFYWEDTPDMIERGALLFDKYAMIHKTEETAIIRFAGIHTDESGNNEFLKYISEEGITGTYDVIYCNYPSMETGDFIEVTTGTHIYIEPGNGRWRAARGIISIKPVNLKD